MQDIDQTEINRLAPIARNQYNSMTDPAKNMLDTTWVNINGEPYQMKYGRMRSGLQMIIRRQNEERPNGYYQIVFTVYYADGGRRKTRRYKRKNLKLKKNKKSKKRTHYIK
jgi:hypothetical protein